MAAGPYQLRVGRTAADYLTHVNQQMRERVLSRLEQIASNPYGPQTKRLTNRGGQRSARVGGLRILFRVDDAARVVDVDRIGPRGQIYRAL